MKFQDLTQLLEQDESIFKPRRVEDRLIRHQQEYNKQIKIILKMDLKVIYIFTENLLKHYQII